MKVIDIYNSLLANGKKGFSLVLHKGKVKADGTPEEVFSQVQLLHDIGLAAPESVELCWELNKEGFDLPLDKLDPEKCAQALYDLVKA